jgi:hypothetical protein
MKKEVFVAIFLGLALGLIVSYGIYTARKSLKDTQNQITVTPEPTPSSGVHNSLTLISPEDESIQAVKEVKITGTTDPESLVIIFVNDKENISSADSSGNFSLQTDLNQGANTIVVRTIDEDGNVAEEERTVIFTTVSLDESVASPSATPAPTKKPTATPSPSPGIKK